MAAALRRVRASIGLLGLCLTCACAGDDTGDGPPPAGRGGRPDSGQGQQLADGAITGDDDSATAVGQGACNAEARMHPLGSAMHVAQPLPASAYSSSPPSSGPHCSTWGRYGTYEPDSPLPACNFVHNLEHGAIAVLYNCPDGCDDLVAQLEAAIDDFGPDPDCAGQGIKRVVLTPYAEMEAKVAASAWGYTFTAECLDADALEALKAFVQAHWGTRGDAPEGSLCAQGG